MVCLDKHTLAEEVDKQQEEDKDSNLSSAKYSDEESGFSSETDSSEEETDSSNAGEQDDAEKAVIFPGKDPGHSDDDGGTNTDTLSRSIVKSGFSTTFSQFVDVSNAKLSRSHTWVMDKVVSTLVAGEEDPEFIIASRLADVMEMIEETEEHLFDALMNIEDPCTNEVEYLQLCVICRENNGVLVAKRRHELRASLDSQGEWAIDLLGGFYTTDEQRVEALHALLQKERAVVRGVLRRERCTSFWLFMERYRFFRTLVRHRHIITPPRREQITRPGSVPQTEKLTVAKRIRGWFRPRPRSRSSL